MDECREVLAFWFPAGAGDDLPAHREYWVWRMGGGAHEDIVARYSDMTERAARGGLDAWASTARGRLALIVVLDQFSRSVWRDSARAFAQDPKALALVLEGYENGHYDALATVWEKAFFSMPLAHCEGPDHLERIDRVIARSDALLEAAPAHLKPMYEFNAGQPRRHREVIATFGRYPHRNHALGRESTPEELAYVARGAFPHLRRPPDMRS